MNIIQDVMDSQGGGEKQYNDAQQLVYARYDRVFIVTDVDIESNEPKMIQAAAIAAVQVLVPINELHADCEFAKAKYYRTMQWNDPKGAKICVTYLYQFSPSFTTTYNITMDSGLSAQETDVEYKDNDYDALTPIGVKYWRNWELTVGNDGKFTIPAKPQSGSPAKDDDPLVSKGKGIHYKPVGGFTITQTIDETKAGLLETARRDVLGCCNHDVWRGNAAGTILIDGIRTISNPYSGEYVAQIHMAYDPDGHDPIIKYYDSVLGIPPNIWRDPNDATPFDPATSNGYKRTRSVKPTNLDTFLAIL